MPLTPRQLEVLDFIVQFVQEHRYAPTLREMADQFDLSRVTVLQHLEALEEKGFLEREANKTRGISVKKRIKTPSSTGDAAPERIQENNDGDGYNETQGGDDGRPSVLYALPVVGYLTDEQTVKPSDTTRYISVEELFSRSEDCFLLEVRCSRWSDEHIIDGDYLIVHEGQSGEPGDMVVLRTDADEMYVGCFQDGEVTIPLENVDESAGSRDDQIVGVVNGVIRPF